MNIDDWKKMAGDWAKTCKPFPDDDVLTGDPYTQSDLEKAFLAGAKAAAIHCGDTPHINELHTRIANTVCVLGYLESLK